MEATKVSEHYPKNLLQKIVDRLDNQEKQINELRQLKPNRIKDGITNRDLFNVIEDKSRIDNHRFSGIDKRFSKMNKEFNQKFNDINKTIMAMNNNFNRRFAHVDQRFAQVDQRFNHMFYAQMGTIVTIIVAGLTILFK